MCPYPSAPCLHPSTLLLCLSEQDLFNFSRFDVRLTSINYTGSSCRLVTNAHPPALRHSRGTGGPRLCRALFLLRQVNLPLGNLPAAVPPSPLAHLLHRPQHRSVLLRAHSPSPDESQMWLPLPLKLHPITPFLALAHAAWLIRWNCAGDDCSSFNNFMA